MAGETWRVAIDDEVESTLSIVHGAPTSRGWIAVAQTAVPDEVLVRGTSLLRVVEGPYAGRTARARMTIDPPRVTFTGLTSFDGENLGQWLLSPSGETSRLPKRAN